MGVLVEESLNESDEGLVSQGGECSLPLPAASPSIAAFESLKFSVASKLPFVSQVCGRRAQSLLRERTRDEQQR